MNDKFVAVIDPYFGTYYRIFLFPGLVLYTGPCAQTTIRIGRIWTSGTMTDVDGTNEKDCGHMQVEGVVTGAIENPPDNVLPFGTASYSRVDSYYGGKLTQTAEYNQQLQESDSTAVLTCYVMRTERYKGKVQAQRDAGADFLFSRSVDRRSGSVTYTYVTCQRTWGNYKVSPVQCVATPCPFGDAAAEQSMGIPSARHWVNETLKLAGSVTTNHDARSQAVYNALDNMSITDLNWLETCQDLRSPLDSIRKLSAAFGGTGWVRWVRGMSSLHLFWRYVIKTGILDAQDAYKLIGFLRHGQRAVLKGPFESMIGRGAANASRQGLGFTETQEYHAKVALSPGFGPFSTLSQLQLLGLAPSVAELWDVLPFSFVVDWVIPVGKLLSNVSSLTATCNLPLRYIVVSRKTVRTFRKVWTTGPHTFTVTLTATYYRRWVRRSFPYMTGGILSLKDPRKQALTGAALLAQYVVPLR